MTVLKEGAALATMGGLMGAMTVFFMAMLVAWTLWAWWPSRRHVMDEAARMPLED